MYDIYYYVVIYDHMLYSYLVIVWHICPRHVCTLLTGAAERYVYTMHTMYAYAYMYVILFSNSMTYMSETCTLLTGG